MTRPILAVALAAAFLGVVGAAFAARGFSDAAGDVNTAPDLTGVEITETAPGVLTIGLAIGNFETLPAGSWVNLWFDTDSDQDTGAEGDEALVRHVTGGATQVYRWTGSQLMEVADSGVTSSFADGVLSATIPRAAIGATAPFGLLVVTARGQAVADEQLVASDFTPNAGRLAYVGPAATRVTDPVGDHDAAPDITAVRVSDSRSGWVTFDVSIPNYAVLPEASALVLSIDADANPRTGDSGADVSVAVAAGEIAMERWDGRRWIPDDLPTRARFRTSANRASIDVHVSELRTASRFRFSLLAADVNTAIQGVVALDIAPDDFSMWTYVLTNKSTLTLVAGPLAATPMAPVAGRPFAVAIAVTRSDTNRPIAAGSVACRVLVAGERVSAKGSVAKGAARCSLVVPARAKGSALRGIITVKSGGVRVARTFAYRVR